MVVDTTVDDPSELDHLVVQGMNSHVDPGDENGQVDGLVAADNYGVPLDCCVQIDHVNVSALSHNQVDQDGSFFA